MISKRARRGLALGVALLAVLAFAPVGNADITGSEARKWKPDIGAAKRYAESRAGTVTFAVSDLRGRLHQRNGDGTAPMASTFKVMLMVAYLRQENVEDRRLTHGEKALINPMIRVSDNKAATRIRDMLGREPIERLANAADMKDFQWNSIWGYCRTSARDQARFLRKLNRYVPDRHIDYAKRQLRKIVSRQRWGVGQVKPGGWDLMFKGGWGSGSGAVDHQVARLARDGHKLGVGVLTEGSPSHDYGKQTLKGTFARLLRDLPR